jgi:hypothetical protein
VGALLLCAPRPAPYTIVNGRVIVREGHLTTVDLPTLWLGAMMRWPGNWSMGVGGPAPVPGRLAFAQARPAGRPHAQPTSIGTP